MKFRTFVVPVLLLSAVFMVAFGCNTARESGQTVTPPPSEAKVTLEEIAASGSLAQKAELRTQLEELREAKPELAETLLTDYQELVSQSSPEAVKTKAQEMAEKL